MRPDKGRAVDSVAIDLSCWRTRAARSNMPITRHVLDRHGGQTTRPDRDCRPTRTSLVRSCTQKSTFLLSDCLQGAGSWVQILYRNGTAADMWSRPVSHPRPTETAATARRSATWHQQRNKRKEETALQKTDRYGVQQFFSSPCLFFWGKKTSRYDKCMANCWNSNWIKACTHTLLINRPLSAFV
jgi:hypothetical protein